MSLSSCRLAVLAGCLAWSSVSLAQTISNPPTEPVRPLQVSGRPATSLAGWAEFCRRFPAECQLDPSEPATIPLTTSAWQTIVTTNRRVNASIKPLTDQQHWGVAERWSLPTDGYGDCEDYQLLKRKLLVEAGFPRRALRMTVVIDEEGEGHAILLVRTDKGEFVLDNKRNAVLPWNETGYVYVKREGDAGQAWVSLGGQTSPVATATH
jgi:predicted transglutaminase-like cysteine proteinase